MYFMLYYSAMSGALGSWLTDLAAGEAVVARLLAEKKRAESFSYPEAPAVALVEKRELVAA